MQTVQVTLEVPKESKEVVDFVAKLIEVARTEGKAGLSRLLPEFMVAVEGISELQAELNQGSKGSLAAYAGLKIVDALTSKVQAP